MKQYVRLGTTVLMTTLIASMAARADTILTISDGVTSIGPITVLNGQTNYSTPSFDSSWSSISVAVDTVPAVGTVSSPIMNLNVSAQSLGLKNSLTITLSQNNLGPTSGSNNVAASL